MALFTTRTTVETHAMIDLVVDNTRVHGGRWEYCLALMFRTHMAVDMPGGMPGVDGDLAELRELSRRIGDRWIRAQVASATAEAGVMRGRFAQARAAYEEALLLSREVGAHAEAPFLLARLAELAHRTGDMAEFERNLAEAESEAERYQVHDARAYCHFLSATAALQRGEIAEARRLVTEAAGAVGRGSPPSQFNAAVEGLAARITVHERGPGRGPAMRRTRSDDGTPGGEGRPVSRARHRASGGLRGHRAAGGGPPPGRRADPGGGGRLAPVRLPDRGAAGRGGRDRAAGPRGARSSAVRGGARRGPRADRRRRHRAPDPHQRRAPGGAGVPGCSGARGGPGARGNARTC